MVLAAVISIQVGFAVSFNLFSVFGPLGVLFLRVGIAGILLAFLNRRHIKQALNLDPIGIAILCLVMAAQYACFMEAIARIPLAIVVTIGFTGPLGLALLTSRRAQDSLWVVMAGAGIVLLVPTFGVKLNATGVALAFCSAFGWAGFVLLSRRLGRSTEGWAGLAVATFGSALILFPFAGIEAITAAYSHPGAFLTMVAVATFASAIPLTLEYHALRTISPQRYGVLVSTEPVVATLVGAILLDERIGTKSLIAVLLISAASVGMTVMSRREHPGPG
jgi:inner membrane transporter RhtA